MSLLSRLLGNTKIEDIDLSQEDLTGAQVGFDALYRFAFGKDALGDRIINKLRSEDEGKKLGEANSDERIVLNLWGITLLVMAGLPKVSEAEKRTFLDQYHKFAFFICRPDGPEKREAWVLNLRRISRLSQTRYEEYFTAYREMMRRNSRLPATPLMRIIVRNLFGVVESDSILFAVIIGIIVMSSVIEFAKVFGTEEDWAQMRECMETAHSLLVLNHIDFLSLFPE